MTLLQTIRKDAQYLETNITGGNASPSSPKYEDFVTDAETLIRNLRRYIYATHPPATIEERLSYLVSTVAAIAAEQGTLVSDIANQTKTAVDDAAARVIVVIGSVADLTAQRDAALAAQATAEANVITANDAAAASEAARAQAAADLDTANANLATTQAALDAATADATADAVTLAGTIDVANSIAPSA